MNMVYETSPRRYFDYKNNCHYTYFFQTIYQDDNAGWFCRSKTLPDPREHKQPCWTTELFLDDGDGRYDLIAGATLAKRRDNMWETHMDSLPYDLTQVGLGSLFYRYLINFGIQRGFTVCSSHTPSSDAQATWRRMERYYHIFHTKSNVIVLGKKIPGQPFFSTNAA